MSPSFTVRTWRADRRRRHVAEAGSTLVMVMIIATVLSVVAANLLFSAVSRYHTTFQSATWQECIIGAEAGVDLAMNELRKRVVQGPSASFKLNWTAASPAGTAFADYGHAFPTGTSAYTLASHGGEGSSLLQARVYVDVPGADASPTINFAVAPTSVSASFISVVDNPNLADADGIDRSRWWYRIRSLGITGVSGGPQANIDKRDSLLRRLSFFSDWRTGQAVSSAQAARMVEVLVKPETNFRNALMADKQINLNSNDVLIDSYDSSKGFYNDPSNIGTMGNIATNGQLINANHATVHGDALTNNGTVKAGDQVTGQQSSNFYEELTPLTTAMLNPAWAGVTDGGVVITDTTYTANTSASAPTTVRLDGINLPDGGHVISLAAPTAPQGTNPPPPSYIKIYVQGDINTTGTSYINIDPNVNAIIYFTGNINLSGFGIINNSYLASHLVLNGIQPPANADGTFPARSINVATTEDFEGIIYAPNHDLNLALQAASSSSSLLGTVIGLAQSVLAQITSLQNQITSLDSDITGNQIAYDQALAIYNKTGAPGQYSKMQAAQAQIASDQAKVGSLSQQITILQGNANPESSAGDHAQGYNGIYGAFVARTIGVASKTHIHYDETLRQAGPVNHYEVVNWFEDNLAHDAAGAAEQFWWPVPGS